ncbi:DUF47 domain-containing protein [Rarobacter incanus]|uniref:Phosphate transport regulator n=1 Tax=Rarobacter incanus TaxID=153494 RepID=A0A542SRN9_9MICO|nr:DUF47 family protein [Rarobacter incanus]TQK76897.1 hypothetical protein FB389_1599 [Rarobacter incanus]
MRFTPRDNTFFELLAESAQQLVEGSNILAQITGAEGSDRKKLAKRMSEIEHAGDEATHAIIKRLNSTFVTPFDRDDIYNLASGLDDCLDYMDEAAERIVLYKIDELPDRVDDQVEILRRMAELTATAMPGLRSMNELHDYWVEINRLENQADKAYRKLISHLFEDVKDPIQLMKQREVVEVLEKAADAFEKVANFVETIAVKEA